MMLMLCYPKCSTCQKAKKWLANGAQPTDTVRALMKLNGIL